jgi:hypothetical protein
MKRFMLLLVLASLAFPAAALAGGYETCPKGMSFSTNGNFCQTPDGKQRAQPIYHSVPSEPVPSSGDPSTAEWVLIGLASLVVLVAILRFRRNHPEYYTGNYSDNVD